MKLVTHVYRAHHPGWAFSPTSGDGAAAHGGRFNQKGRPALYTALSYQGAWMETQQGFAFKAQPVTLCTYEVDCDDIEDLRDPLTLARLGLTPADLACAWEDIADQGRTPPSWALSEQLISEGVAGIIVPSFAPGATALMSNVVFWDWHDSGSHMVRAIDDHGRLPKNRDSWK